MPFITQGKTNWKFLFIVVILVVIVGGGIYVIQQKFFNKEEIVPSPTVNITPIPSSLGLSGKIIYISDSTTPDRDTIILDFDRELKFKIGIPYVYRGDNDQFLLLSPDKTKIALLGEGTSTFEVTSSKISNFFIKDALAGIPLPVATLYIIDLEKKTKIELVEDILFNDYATTSSVQWMDNNSICYHEYYHTDPSPLSDIALRKTWKVSLEGLRTEISSEECHPQPQESSITGWKTLKINEDEILMKTDDGIYPLGNRWESTSITLKNDKNNQQKILVARGSQLVTSETFTLAPLKNAFLFETVKQGKTKMEKEGNEEIEVMSLDGKVLLRTAGTYATWIP